MYNQDGYEETYYGFRYDVVGSSFPSDVMPYVYNVLIKGDDLFDFYIDETLNELEKINGKELDLKDIQVIREEKEEEKKVWM